MKRVALSHPKMQMLTEEIEKVYARHGRDIDGLRSHALAVGIMESLWGWAAQYAPRGDIGRWSDAAIARGVSWELPPNDLIEILLRSRWIDRAEEPFRLVIHDVKDHASNGWRQKLEDKGWTWWDGSPPRKYKLIKNKRAKKTPQKPSEQSDAKAKVDAAFNAWWDHVWLKVGKQAARRAFPAALKYVCLSRGVKGDQATQFLIQQADDERDRHLVPGNELRARLHPVTWLTGRRWEDEIKEFQQKSPRRAAEDAMWERLASNDKA